MRGMKRITGCTYNYIVEIFFPKDKAEMDAYFKDKNTPLTGEKILLDAINNPELITSDPLKIEFCSKLNGLIQVLDMDQNSLIRYIQDPKNLPSILNSVSEEEARKYLFEDIREGKLKEDLARLGYIEKIEESELRKKLKKESEVKVSDMVKILKDNGYTVTKAK